MATDLELDRVAAAVNALRPDWPVASLRTYLRSRHASRAYADLAAALVAVAVDPASTTPARVEQPGPWWQATRAVGPTTYRPGPDGAPCPRDGHEHEPAATCRACRAELLAGHPLAAAVRGTRAPDDWRDRAAEQLEARRILTRLELDLSAVRRGAHLWTNRDHGEGDWITCRAAAATLVVIANGVQLEGEHRVELAHIRAGAPIRVLGYLVHVDDNVPPGVVEVDAPPAPTDSDPGSAGVETREDTTP